MDHVKPQTGSVAALDASWRRCERDYKLNRDAAKPILRLQSAEITPRRDALTEQIGGRHGIFRKLAAVAADAGQCLLLTDKDGILVRLESRDAQPSWNGIALGSVWDERVAGTNGVSMALSEGCDFTVRGRDHYFAQLRGFSCTAIPLRDARNGIIGVVNLSAIDRGNPADSTFARHLLGAAASRLQQTLFEEHFKDAAIVSIAVPGRRELIKGGELVAVGDDGKILGATSEAHVMSGLTSFDALKGERFDAVFGMDAQSLDKVPGRVMSVRRDHGPMLDVWVRAPVDKAARISGWRPDVVVDRPRRRPPTLRDIRSEGSVLAALCTRAQTCLAHGLPLLIEGNTGTGKSALALALVEHAPQRVTIDCATLDDSEHDRGYIRSLMQQLRITSRAEAYHDERPAVVFDNIDEMPSFAQSALRAVLGDFEVNLGAGADVPLIVATTRRPLAALVETGDFRADLYSLLSAATLALPPLRTRGGVEQLADKFARMLAGHEVKISTAARDVMANHDWPGNVRELLQTLQRALILGDGARIGALDLGISPAPRVEPQIMSRSGSALSEADLLRDALHGAGWNVSKAARRLNIGRATIHRKMKTHGITRPT